MQMKAMIVSDETAEAARKLLHVAHIPTRAIEESAWIVWGNSEWPEVRMLPQAVFTDRYVVVGHAGNDIYIVERL